MNADTNDDTGDYFGMEFLYSGYESALGNTPLYNGGISAIKWKGAGAVSGTSDRRAYFYTYDKADRLLTAASRMSSASAWNKESSVHNEIMTYDDSGNIKTLKRSQRKHRLVGTTASYITEIVDNLSYVYTGNTMTKVEDAIAFSAGQTGFDNGSTDATEYTYNSVGSLTADKNKGISSITYNDLGKPVVILFTDLRKIEYIYDAAGTKLTVKNYVAGSSTPQTTTDYVGSFVYENGVLTLFSSPEGRVINKGGTLEYEYSLADHQGNTRVVFSSVTPTPDAPVATFEGNTDDNASAYANVVPSNVVSFASANHTAGGIKVLRMNQTTKIAATKSLQVYPGDKVDLEVWEYHEGSSGFGTTGTRASTLITMVAGAFATGVPGVDAQISSGVNAGVTAFGAGGGNQGDSRPAAYLNYILFDKNYNVLTMGWQLAPAATFTKQKLSFSTLNIKEEGYLFAYLSYDDDSNNWVYFDDLKVTHTRTNIVQYNEYYPFGLQTATSWTRTGAKNNFLYNEGGELNSTTGVYDLFYRNYDPVLGRLNQIDPKSEKYAGLSPYSYVGNSPVVNNDPLGDDWKLDLWGAIQVLDAQDDGRGGGEGGGYGSGGGYGGSGGGAMAAYQSYGMWPGAAARFASLANYGAHWSFGGHADYSGVIAAGNAILGERAAGIAYKQALIRAARDGDGEALRGYAGMYGFTIRLENLGVQLGFLNSVDKQYAGPGLDPDADELIREYEENQMLGWGYIFAAEVLLENGVLGDRINRIRNDLVEYPMFKEDKNLQMINRILNLTVQAVRTVKGHMPGNGKGDTMTNKLSDPYFTGAAFYFAVRGTYLLHENETVLAPKIKVQNPDYYHNNIGPIFSPQKFNSAGSSSDW